jgi:hypothetical protein
MPCFYSIDHQVYTFPLNAQASFAFASLPIVLFAYFGKWDRFELPQTSLPSNPYKGLHE